MTGDRGVDRTAMLKAWCLLVALSLCAPPGAQSQVGFPAWVGLYDPAQLGWLENENRLSELCSDSATLSECYARVLAPRVTLYLLHVRPDSTSRTIGELIVVAVPGRGLTAHFHDVGSQRAVSFTPDLHLQDWGYGPYFHQTIAARAGNWFGLPRGPWKEPVWIYRDREDERPSVIALGPGDIIEMRGSSWFVTAATTDRLVARPEQPADLWCQEGEPPALTSVEPTSFVRDELVDADGHLVLRLKYMKGC